jgi:ketosteroid isomerase-like protein
VANDPETIVRELYAAMNAGDFEAGSRLADPGVEWVSDPRTGLGTVRGRAEVLRFFRDQADSFADFAVELEGLEVVGDEVLALIRA